jgi:hypothetical protein
MAWGSGGEMKSLSGQYDLTNPSTENLNYRHSNNPRVACRFCPHFTAPADCALLGLVRATDVCDAYSPDPHPEPLDLNALAIDEGERTMTSGELAKFLDDGVRRLTTCEHLLPNGTARRHVRKLKEDLLALKPATAPPARWPNQRSRIGAKRMARRGARCESAVRRRPVRWATRRSRRGANRISRRSGTEARPAATMTPAPRSRNSGGGTSTNSVLAFSTRCVHVPARGCCLD